MAFRIGLERRQIDDGEFGREAFEFGAVRTNEQRADEQRVPGEFGVDARANAVFRIGAAIEILREQRLAFRVRKEVLIQILEMLLAELAVAVLPHGFFGQGIDHRVLVLGRASGVVAGFRAERAAGDDLGFPIGDGMLVERGLGQIPVNLLEILEAECIGAKGFIAYARLLHENLPKRAGYGRAGNP